MQPFTILRDPDTGRHAIRSDRASDLSWTVLDGDHRFLTDSDVAGWEMVGTVADLLAGVPFEASGVEPWIRSFREAWPAKSDKWWAVDELLDDYRLHAVTGTPLGEHACEGTYCDGEFK